MKVQEAIHLLSSLIATPSISKEESTAADFIEKYITKHKLPFERIGNNILVLNKQRYESNEPTLLLNSHIDTVKPSSSWTKNPFEPIIEDDYLYGLGSNDAGASLVCMLLTTIELFDKLPYNLAFCASAEEEISGVNGISAVLNKYPKFNLALVGEPTDMQPAVAEKGLMVLDCKALGVSGHAARNEGENAIYKALKDIEWFKEYELSKASPFLGKVRMSVTQVNAGSQHNVIPDECKFVVDVRGNGCYTNQEILNEIKDNVSCEVIPRSTRLNSSQLSSDHPFYKHLTNWGYQPFGSPTLSDQALMSFPSLKMGPGSSSRSHTADEFIKISEIKDALVKYDQLLRGFRFD